jgi:transposase-like protein
LAAGLGACDTAIRLSAGDPQPAIRKMIYTTNAVESLNRSLRKIIKTRGSFPTDEAALKLLFRAIRNAGLHWRPPIEWTAAIGQFAILFGDRFEPSAR